MNKTFAVAALIAASVSANWHSATISVDGSDRNMVFQSKSFSNAFVDEAGRRINVENNNSVFLRNSESTTADAAFKPYIRGGAISYDVDLSSVDCGCVSGMYLVATNDYGCGEDATS